MTIDIMIPSFSPQAPLDNLDNEFQFPLIPTGDSISTALVTASDATVQITNTVIINNNVVAWITGGTVGVTCLITCKATTAQGRVYNRSAYLPIMAFI